MEQNSTSYLQRISHILLLNGWFLDNPGLYSGKMGLALFFFRYARHTQCELYSEYGFELIEKIQNSIHQETPINYKQGIAGIGAAIEYLVQKNYIKTCTDETLEEFDNRLLSIRNLPHLSFEDIISIAYYAVWRFYGSNSKKELPSYF